MQHILLQSLYEAMLYGWCLNVLIKIAYIDFELTIAQYCIVSNCIILFEPHDVSVNVIIIPIL